jgi:putative membrane protein
MHAGTEYTFKEFIVWTRRNIYKGLIIASIPVLLYQIIGLKWIALPWAVVALLGTATAFTVGFKNTQTYNRAWEARQIWGSILNTSRMWAVMCRDYFKDTDSTKLLVYRHFAWLTALRYQMRESRKWENGGKKYNKEYKEFYTIPEDETELDVELAKYLSTIELEMIMHAKNKTVQLLAMQSKTIKQLLDDRKIDNFSFLELERMIKELFEHQGKSERIKNFPYPRQFASSNTYFIRMFSILLPFGMLKEFDKLNDTVDGIMKGNMVWLVIPFTMLISWFFTTLDQIGEGTENPFEGSANDIPISQMSRNMERDMREILGEIDLPEPLQPQNNIIL